MLEVRNLSKEFHNKIIFDRVNISAQPGTITIIEGPNGSGKTTLLKCLAGLINYEHGHAHHSSSELSQHNPACRTIIGFSPNQDRTFFPQLTLWQNLQFFAQLFKSKKNPVPQQRIAEFIELFELKKWQSTAYQSCSSGIKRRTSIIRSLLHEPKVLLLDEPFSNIDGPFMEKMQGILQKITHKKNIVTLITTNQETSLPGQRIYLKGDSRG